MPRLAQCSQWGWVVTLSLPEGLRADGFEKPLVSFSLPCTHYCVLVNSMPELFSEGQACF